PALACVGPEEALTVRPPRPGEMIWRTRVWVRLPSHFLRWEAHPYTCCQAEAVLQTGPRLDRRPVYPICLNWPCCDCATGPTDQPDCARVARMDPASGRPPGM